ncbi:hypothetical protein MKX01_011422, partial [Papaver californicum]
SISYREAGCNKHHPNHIGHSFHAEDVFGFLRRMEKATPDARVITVSSDGMLTAPLNEDLQFSKKNFDGDVQYARTKTVQVALTERWAKVYSEKGVELFSMHPGYAMHPACHGCLEQATKVQPQ